MQKHAYRPDIDGLRAIAVAAVVIYHAMPQFVPGGFVGVDIFFVISGYLIGGIIYSAICSKSFSFLDFYARRARRILPALLVVVTVSMLLGAVLLDLFGFLELSAQSIGALIAIPNIYFWRHTDYFATAAELKPLLMTWSLGVEEQFYVVFPFILFGLTRLPERLRLAAMTTLTVLAFGLSAFIAKRDPISAFYLLPPRAWELNAGATLALAHYNGGISRLQGQSANILGWIGFGMLAASMFLFSDVSSFPIIAILVSVIGTTLLIHVSGSWINRRILSYPAVVFVGLVSYSWYLWHWPLLAYVRVVSDDAPVNWALPATAAASFLIAVVSWKYVESPFRTRTKSSYTTLGFAGLAMAVALAFPVFGKLTYGWPEHLPESVIAVEQARVEGRGSCMQHYDKTEFNTSDECQPPGATIAVLGDSHAAALGPGLQAYAAEHGTSVAIVSKTSCLPLLGYTSWHAKQLVSIKTCGTFLEGATRRIIEDPSIDVVVIAAFWPPYEEDRLYAFEHGAIGNQLLGSDHYIQGLSRLTSELNAAGKKVILVGDVPVLPFEPLLRITGDAMPVRGFMRKLLGKSEDENAIPGTVIVPERSPGSLDPHIRQLAESNSQIVYMDARAQICSGDVCKFVIDGHPIYFDDNHLAVFGSKIISWDEAFSSLGLASVSNSSHIPSAD